MQRERSGLDGIGIGGNGADDAGRAPRRPRRTVREEVVCMTCQEEDTILATVVNGQEAIVVARDALDESPREWSNVGVISMNADGGAVNGCRGRYAGLGEETYHTYGCADDAGSGEERERCGADLFEGALACLPLFVEDWHWKYVLRTEPREAGQAPDGYIYATDESAVSMGCVDKNGRPSAARVAKMLRDEIDAYNLYLAGEVYCVRHVRNAKCSMGRDHEDVLDELHGVYPPYGAGKAAAGANSEPVDYAASLFIQEIADAEAAEGGGDAAVRRWYLAASKCAEFAKPTRAYWRRAAGKAAAVKKGGRS